MTKSWSKVEKMAKNGTKFNNWPKVVKLPKTPKGLKWHKIEKK